MNGKRRAGRDPTNGGALPSGWGAAAAGRVAMLAALYALLTVLPPFNSFSYGLVQVRVAEALTVLPYLTPLGIPALFLGCLVANVIGGLGPVDMVLGSLTTLAAAYLSSRMPSPGLAPLPPVLLNGLVVGTYVPLLLHLEVPLPLGWAYVAAGEAVACYGLGYPLLASLRRRPRLLERLFGQGLRGR